MPDIDAGPNRGGIVLPTRVLVDGRGFYDASAFRGIGRYLRNVVAGLACTPDLEVTALVTPRTPVPPGVAARNVRRHAPGRFARREHDLLLPLDLRRAPADVVHSPATDPPRQCDRPWVQTLHDVIPLVNSDPRLTTERRRWARNRDRFARATAVIAVSRHCADEGIAVLGLDPSRVHVVHHGVEDRFRPQPDVAADEPYLLFVGEYDPRKGHAEAFEVIGALADLGFPHRLKVAGRLAPWFADTMRELVAAAPHPERIELIGHVGDELPGLYAGADAVVVTSRHEGFGFPALEAMACGTPVVSFANTSLVEVVDTGGVLVADGDVAAFTQAVRRVLAEPAWHAELRERGLEQARRFSWNRSVQEHADIFRSLS